VPGEIDLWGRIERSQAAVTEAASAKSGPSQSEEEKAAGKRRLRRQIRALDTVSVLFWTYVLAKIFFIDVDRRIVRAVAPSYEYLVDYRFLLYAAVIAIVALVQKSWLWGILYIILFPILFLVWKVPAFFIRRRSWALFLGVLQAIFTALSDFRYNFVSKTLALFACVFILTLDTQGILAASFGYLAYLLARTYWRTIKKMVLSPSFLRVQKQKIGDIVNSAPIRQLSDFDEALKREDVQLYSEKQLGEITAAISWGIAVNRGLYYWSYQLERYRRNVVPSLIFSALSYVWLFLGTILSFAFLNFALYKLDPSNFKVEDEPVSFLRMTVYSLSRLSLNDGGGIGASSDRAYSLQLAEGLAGVLFLGALVANFIVTAKRERSESELRDLVHELRERAKEDETRFKERFYVSVEEAHQRLSDLGSNLTRLLSFLMTSVPPDFFEDPPRRSSPR
jgi:hypothetical protein